VLQKIGVSRTTLWRMVQAGTFPQPVWITQRNRAFVLDAVEAWMKARAEGTPVAMGVHPIRVRGQGSPMTSTFTEAPGGASR